jgi:hypothetical protein
VGPLQTTSITIGIPVSDLGRAIDWYGRMLGLESGIEPVQDIFEYEVFPGSWLQLFHGEAAGSEHVFRIGVADIEQERDRLLSIGIAVGEIVRVEGTIAYCEFGDLDGNQLSLYHVLA